MQEIITKWSKFKLFKEGNKIDMIIIRPNEIKYAETCIKYSKIDSRDHGFTLGILGAGLAFGAEWLMYEALRSNLDTIDTLQLFNFVPFTDLLLPMIITFASAGVFVGFLGSWTSIRKFMDV